MNGSHLARGKDRSSMLVKVCLLSVVELTLSLHSLIYRFNVTHDVQSHSEMSERADII